MRKTLFIFALFIAAGAFPAIAEGTNEVSDPFQSFRIIAERNIFNPNRSNRPARAATPPREAARQPVVESFTLIGTLSYEKGDFAVFEGTSDSFKKVLKISDAIAGFKIAAVGSDFVRLDSGDEQIELKLGGRMQRQDEGEWKPVGREEGGERPGGSRSGGLASNRSGSRNQIVAAASTRGSASSSSAGSAGSAADDDDDELLRKLMEKREQELNR